MEEDNGVMSESKETPHVAVRFMYHIDVVLPLISTMGP